MIRKTFVVAALTASALLGSQAQASVQFPAISGIIGQLHNNATFSGNNFQFSTCNGSSCTTQFTGVSGLRAFNNYSGLNDWAGTNNYSNNSNGFENYQFTFHGAASFFGNNTPPPQTLGAEYGPTQQPVPEPGTWTLIIIGFGIVGLAMRRRAAAVNFA